MSHEIKFELLQPWSTFVMRTQLPPLILEKMIKIIDEIVENREYWNTAAGQVEDQFLIDLEILEREELMGYYLDELRNFVIQAYYQSRPFNKENILKDEWYTQIQRMWINSQKDNEYFPLHFHTECSVSAVMYLKIPEYLPNRRLKNARGEDAGAISFSNNCSTDRIWGFPTMTITPQVGDFFIFSASQQHQVYPFRTPDGKGERRSVSLNAQFTSKSEQDELRKQQEKQEAI